ncbi:MurR/RpiR family transcriptional regulator [Caproiciproducens sp. CPB-2]|uniref:MurR/RpiR family transcriptional regulator n=1 Tax=Caproiciproducens sp. CPB-2 TaxID=3030017 RepID=UPI0023DC6CFE|nr:MurR/RpiR family transcriptional regulator [Caproiciproducens sp. CPB-2]MDF1496410.1 MurR/RpiR family transcriptional regulator [Caproiciproducens sp. CPB-2]
MVKNMQHKLTSQQKKVAMYVIANPAKTLDLTAAQLAEEISVSEASVVRFSKEIGFKGYYEFKIHLAKDLGADNEQPVPESILRTDSSMDVFQKIMASEQEDLKYTTEMLNKDDFIKAVDMINKAEKIAFFGIGSSYVVAYDAFWHFSNIGKKAQVEQDQGAQMLLAQSLGKNDLAVAISLSGESKITNLNVKIAHSNGVPVISLTQNSKSEITLFSDCVLLTYSKNYQTHDLATASRIAQLAILDALCTGVAVKNWDYALEYHHNISKLIRSQQF